MRRLLRSKSDYSSTILRNQLTSLVLMESLSTTKTRAKQLETATNHLFNQLRRAGQLTATRLAYQTLLDKKAVAKVFEDILPRYQVGETSFVRTLNLPNRQGDNASMAMVSLIKLLKVEPKKEKK